MLTEENAKKLAKELYRLDVSVKPLVGYSDQNFYLQDGKGREFVLKITESGTGPGILEAQDAALAHIAGQTTENLSPRMCPTVDGKPHSTVITPTGETRFVRLLTYVKGKDIRVAGYPGHLMDDLGRFLGTMLRWLETFHYPLLDRYSIWDAKRAGDLEGYLPSVEDRREKELVKHFLAQFRDKAVPLFPELRTGVIHNDANDFNLLVSEDENSITGIIDFEDMVVSYVVCELAIACAYAIHYQDAPLDKIAAVTAGFHCVYPLTEVELEALFYLIPARLCATIAVGRHQQKLNPGNPYVVISVPPAVESLDALSQIDYSQYEEKIKGCGSLPFKRAFG